MKFNLLTVKEIVKLTADAVQISFYVPEELHEEYNFLPGQYITLNINGERRDYSLCESPNDKKWSIGVKSQPNGKISSYLANELKEQQKQLIESDKYKNNFLANMSHELKTPLNSIIVISSIMAKNKNQKLDEEQEKVG